MRRTLSHFVLPALLAIGSYVMVADFVNLRAKPQERISNGQLPWVLPQPWGGYGWRSLTRFFGTEWRRFPAEADEFLQSSAPLYPIDPFQWLDRAQIATSHRQVEDVDQLLAIAASVSPRNRLALWTATQIALQSGNSELAERQIRKWLVDQPEDVGQALFVGRRWIDDPPDLIDRVLPDGRSYLEAVIGVARRQDDLPLARAAWERLHPPPAFGDPVFFDFIETLINAGRVDEAVEQWAVVDRSSASGTLFNGSFDLEFGPPLGFNWRMDRIPNGVRIDRDFQLYQSPPASLRIRFDGKTNVRLNRPWKRVPVISGSRYRLSGAWRAERITTRSRPYLLLSAEGVRFETRIDLPGDDFAWTSFAQEFQVPDGVEIMRLVVRREATQDFDRYIDGSLWLDGLSLQPVVEVPDEFLGSD